MRVHVGALVTVAALFAGACAPAPTATTAVSSSTSVKGRKVLIIGDSLLWYDQGIVAAEVEKGGYWDVVAVDSQLGSTTYRHPNLAEALASTKYDAVVLSFGYNEISDIRGDLAAPIPAWAVQQSWRDVVRVAKTKCLGWITMQYDAWTFLGATYSSVMMTNIRWMNSFIRNTGGKVKPVEWGPVADYNVTHNWPNGDLWVRSDGFHLRESSWGPHALGIKIRETLSRC